MSNLKNNIIVTGGCGFIGSHLVDQLVNDNYNVYVIDDESAESNDVFYKNPKATYFKLDILEADKIDAFIFEKTRAIFHLAAESRIGPAIKNPTKATTTNVMGTVKLLELCRTYNIDRFIYSSTSSVYGLTEKLPTDEQCEIDCLNPYASTKFCGEEMIRVYTKLYGIDSCIFRYFNVFGERSPTKGIYSPVIGIFLNQLKNNTLLTIVGDGEQRRDFVHVHDIVQANILAFNHKEKINGSTFNVGSGVNYSMNEIASFISDNSIHIPFREGEARHTLANISKIKNVLDFNPRVDVKKWIFNQK
jgi:UDP-glucose 4-epimerase